MCVCVCVCVCVGVGVGAYVYVYVYVYVGVGVCKFTYPIIIFHYSMMKLIKMVNLQCVLFRVYSIESRRKTKQVPEIDYRIFQSHFQKT